MASKDHVEETLLESEEGVQASATTWAAFIRHARKDEETGEYFMGEEEFVDAVAPEGQDYHKIKRTQFAVLFRVADPGGGGRVNLAQWNTFDKLLAKPDAEYEIAFRLFASPTTGTVDFESFKEVYARNRGPDSIPFDWNSNWASLYLGGKKARHSLTYPQFAQMLRGLQGERIRQAFLYFDKNGDGYIEPEDFSRIIMETASHKLSDHLLANLSSLCDISPGSKISYGNVRAFQNMIRERDIVELVIRNATSKSSDGMITRADFLDEAVARMRFETFTPMEADILFHFASLDRPSGRLSIADFARVIDASWHSAASNSTAPDISTKAVAESRSILQEVIVSAHHFALGSVAGAFGAFMVYPIDMVKTRMQNQRTARVGQMMYLNSMDCAKKLIRNEGFLGFYSGVLPQLVGVAPEKAIKLTVNDLVRAKFTDPKTSAINPWAEILAGGTAGACQVVFTNPLEIVKIRLQVQGEARKAAAMAGEQAPTKRGAMWIVRHLGLIGLYKGASACLLRDVPFSAIYFPTYNHLKRDFFGESQTQKLGILKLLSAGAIAGMPAAYLTTPFDVIKTRLQVEARRGDTAYTSLRHCAKTIWREEGFRAFFKGGPARILRSSPQFGFTLAGYEVLQGLLPLPGEPTDATPRGSAEEATGLAEATAPLPYLRSRNALKIILDLDLGFGRPKPAPDAGGEGWLPRSLGRRATAASPPPDD